VTGSLLSVDRNTGTVQLLFFSAFRPLPEKFVSIFRCHARRAGEKSIKRSESAASGKPDEIPAYCSANMFSRPEKGMFSVKGNSFGVTAYGDKYY
jgi:hypothetical protein